MVSLKKCLLLCLGIAMMHTPVFAQGMFDPVITVNTQAVTRFELNQRVQFYRALGATGDLAKRSRDELIQDRLKQDLFQKRGITISDEGLIPELEAFAARANLDLAQFRGLLKRNGVAFETFEDFVRINVLWREVIRARFGPRATPTDAEIDRAASANQTGGGLNIRIAEIVIPHSPEQLGEARGIAKQIARNTSTSAFSAAARKYSATPSRDNGGLLPWSAMSALPGPLRSALSGLRPGEIAGPFEVDGAIIIFQVRGLTEGAFKPKKTTALEFITVQLPTAESQAAMVELDTCDDVFGLAQRSDNLQYSQTTDKPENLNQSTQILLGRMDLNEKYLSQVDDTQSKILMLCGRSFAASAELENREAVAERLRSQRLNTLSDGYLAELRSNARITFE